MERAVDAFQLADAQRIVLIMVSISSGVTPLTGQGKNALLRRAVPTPCKTPQDHAHANVGERGCPRG